MSELREQLTQLQIEVREQCGTTQPVGIPKALLALLETLTLEVDELMDERKERE
jgi:hypothetical protein